MDGFRPRDGAFLVIVLLLRSSLLLQVKRFVRKDTADLSLMPLRDLLSFAVFIVSFWPGSIEWRGHRFGVRSDGVLTPRDTHRTMMRTLFLQAPSFDGFDGGAGSRYQAKREIKSFWYPTWLAQPAALVENSKLIDAPPHKTKLAEVTAQAKDFDLAVLHTSVPSFESDVKTIEALKAANPNLKAGLIGAKVAVEADKSLAQAPVIDFVARNEFDFTIKDVADGQNWASIPGLSFRNDSGRHRPQQGSRDPREHGRAALRHAGLQARPGDRELLHRLPEAPLHLDLHRPRLQDRAAPSACGRRRSAAIATAPAGSAT